MNHEFIGNILGFILAHTAAIGDVLEKDELLVPYVITINDGKRSSTEFESETQTQAIENAEKQFFSLVSSNVTSSLARDALITLKDGKKQDIFLFKIWVEGLNKPIEAYQMYQKYPFKLIGHIQIVNYIESGLSPDEQQKFISGLDSGINEHPTGSKKWESWYE